MPSSYLKDLEHKAELAKMYKDTLDHNTDCLPEMPLIASPASGFWEGLIVGAMMASLTAIIITH